MVRRFFHDASDSPPLHYHEFVELVYVVSGQAQHSFEDEMYEIGPGDVFIINPGEAHMFHIPDGIKLEIINCLFMPDIIEVSLLHELKITDSMDYFMSSRFLMQGTPSSLLAAARSGCGLFASIVGRHDQGRGAGASQLCYNFSR